MSTEKTDPKVETKPTNPVPPQEPQVIAPTVEDKPAPKAKGNDDKKPQPEEPKKATTPQKEGGDKKKDPNLELLESLEKLVADINGSINKALGDVAKAGWDKLKKTEVGQAVGRLTDAIGEKVSDIKEQIGKKIDDKVDALSTAFGKTTVGQAIQSIKDTVGSIPDKISKGLVDAIDSATEKVSNIGKKEPGEELDESETQMKSPESTQSEDLLMEAREAFGDMEGWDDLLTDKPKTPTPSEQPALEEGSDLVKGMQ